MGAVLRYLATFGLGVVACLVYLRLHPPPEKAPVTAVFNFDHRQALGGIDHLGIQNGDVLKSVNGVTDQSMLKELLNGYNRGDVCVTIERQSQTQEICVKRTSGHG